jgi:hypothetical protein
MGSYTTGLVVLDARAFVGGIFLSINGSLGRGRWARINHGPGRKP